MIYEQILRNMMLRCMRPQSCFLNHQKIRLRTCAAVLPGKHFFPYHVQAFVHLSPRCILVAAVVYRTA